MRTEFKTKTPIILIKRKKITRRNLTSVQAYKTFILYHYIYIIIFYIIYFICFYFMYYRITAN